jgi:hypothetical protein
MSRLIQDPANEASHYVGGNNRSGVVAADLHRVVA